MESRPEIRISERTPTPDELGRAMPWACKLAKEGINEQTGCAVVLCLVLGGGLLFIFHKWMPGVFLPALIVLLVIAFAVTLWDLRRRLRLWSINTDRLRGKVVSITLPVQRWWRVDADETRETDVLVQVGPGLQIYGYQTVPMSRTPVIEGTQPGKLLTLDYFVITSLPFRHLVGEALLMRVLAEGTPDEPGDSLKWSDVFTKAYDIGVYAETDEGVGSYPWPTAIEFFADLTSPGLRDSVRVIDERKR
ncbi:MAG: hypothetical protein Phyf2KO_15410 [Phycisphaerales bacterium]